jgi:hypothetical protein
MSCPLWLNRNSHSFKCQMNVPFRRPLNLASLLGISPEALDAVDMATFVGELVLSMVNAEMLLIPQVNKTIVASPPIRMDDAFQAYATSNDSLQSRTAAIGHDLGVHSALALEDAENNCFAACAATSEIFHSPWTEIALVDFNFAENRSLLLAELSYLLANSQDKPIDGVSVQARDLGYLRGIQINGKQLH